MTVHDVAKALPSLAPGLFSMDNVPACTRWTRTGGAVGRYRCVPGVESTARASAFWGGARCAAPLPYPTRVLSTTILRLLCSQ